MLASIHAPGPITLVGGAPLAPGLLEQARGIAPEFHAADGGADALLAAGIEPRSVIGDLDSLSPAARARLGDRVVHDPCQDTTDLEKCLSRLRAPLILGLGFVGGRVDHTLAALGALPGAPGPVLLLGAEDVVMALGGALEMDPAPGTRISLMPLAPVRVASEGLRWGTDLVLSPTGRTGASNAALGRVRLSPEGPGALLVMERAALASLLAASGPGAPSRFLKP